MMRIITYTITELNLGHLLPRLHTGLTVKPLCSQFKQGAKFVQRVPNRTIKLPPALGTEVVFHFFCAARQSLGANAQVLPCNRKGKVSVMLYVNVTLMNVWMSAITDGVSSSSDRWC